MVKERQKHQAISAYQSLFQGKFGALDVGSSLKKEATFSIRLPFRAMGAPRISRKDTWEKRDVVEKYWSYCGEIRLRCGLSDRKKSQSNTFKTADKVWVTAHFWTNLPELWGQPYLETPDFDNILKGVTDALFIEDCGIWDGRCQKFWGERDEIELEISGLVR